MSSDVRVKWGGADKTKQSPYFYLSYGAFFVHDVFSQRLRAVHFSTIVSFPFLSSKYVIKTITDGILSLRDEIFSKDLKRGMNSLSPCILCLRCGVNFTDMSSVKNIFTL
jgi:hypothetical protein